MGIGSDRERYSAHCGEGRVDRRDMLLHAHRGRGGGLLLQRGKERKPPLVPQGSASPLLSSPTRGEIPPPRRWDFLSTPRCSPGMCVGAPCLIRWASGWLGAKGSSIAISRAIVGRYEIVWLRITQAGWEDF